MVSHNDPFPFFTSQTNMDFSRMLVIRCLKTLLIFPLAWIKQLLPILHTHVVIHAAPWKEIEFMFNSFFFLFVFHSRDRHKRWVQSFMHTVSELRIITKFVVYQSTMSLFYTFKRYSIQAQYKHRPHFEAHCTE